MEQQSQASHSSSTKSKPQISLTLQPRLKLPSNTSTAAEQIKTAKVPEINTRQDVNVEHSFITDVADVRQMEQGLLQLLDDFHLGKLQAFGHDCTFEKMDEVRERQERLARLHFDLDNHQESKDGSQAIEASNKNLGRLMDSLQELCSSIQNLQKDHPNTQAS